MKAITSNKQSDSVHSTFSSSPKGKNGESFFPSLEKSESFFGPATLQPKLKVGQPDNKYEQEADRVADAVMRMPDPQIQRQPVEEELQMKHQPDLQRKCKECEEEEKLQRKRKVQTKSADSSGESSANPLFETTEAKYKQFGPRVMTNVQEAAGEPMVMGDWKAWIMNGEVVNKSSRDVTVWSSDNGTYTIPAHSRSASWGEDVDHVRDIHGQWWKIGWNTAVVDSDGEVSGAKCRSPEKGQDCGWGMGDYPVPTYAKLKADQPNDPFEQEADAVAEKVVNGEASIQRKCAACEEEEKLQRQPEDEEEKLQGKSLVQLKAASLDRGESTSPWMEQQINSSRGSGQPLPKYTRSFMENGIGAGFQKVKVHTDNNAIQMNRELGARAFTVGNDIYFNSGEYNPTSQSGKLLLAHELTHVVQQSTSGMRSIQRDENGSAPSPDAKDDSFDFDFELLPPAIKFTIGNWMLQANTGSAELQFSQNLMRYSLGYSYGGNIFASINRPGFGSRLGVDPTSGATSLSFRHDQFRFGGSVSPDSGAFGLRFGYGAPLLPMPGALSESVYGGWTGASSILGGLGSMQDPISFYQAHSDDVDAIMGAVRALRPLADEESTRFGVGLRFNYNPDTGILLGGGMQWHF